MESIDSNQKLSLLAKGATADIYVWGIGHVLKLFRERNPSSHENEVVATRVAHKANLSAPKVIEGLIKVDKKEGIVLERVDGPTMAEYLIDNPGKAESCARKTAELQAQIHSTRVSDIQPLEEILTWSVKQANPLEERTRWAVLDVLNGLPEQKVLCHNDFYPNNIIVSRNGLMVVIDWAIGTSGNPLADHARTWLISRLWLDSLIESKAPEQIQAMWQKFWDAFFRRYVELRLFTLDDFNHWKIVAATVSLYWDRSIASTEKRVAFIKAALYGAKHPWLNSLD